jgi:hypothetical protein
MRSSMPRITMQLEYPTRHKPSTSYMEAKTVADLKYDTIKLGRDRSSNSFKFDGSHEKSHESSRGL